MRQFLNSLVVVTAIGGFFWNNPGAIAEPAADASSTIVFFYYKDVAAVAPFYEQTLGLEKTFDMEWVKIYRITPTSSIGLTQEGHGYHKVFDDKPAMLSIVTDDVDTWYSRLKSAGVKILTELPSADDMPAAEKAQIRGFIAEDPGGYTIEFFTWR